MPMALPSVADVIIELQNNGIAVPGATATITPAVEANEFCFCYNH